LNGCSDQNVVLSDPLVFLTFYLLKYFHYFTEFIEAVIALFQNQSVLTATTLLRVLVISCTSVIVIVSNGQDIALVWLGQPSSRYEWARIRG
jgi:hypothetical protein